MIASDLLDEIAIHPDHLEINVQVMLPGRRLVGRRENHLGQLVGLAQAGWKFDATD